MAKIVAGQTKAAGLGGHDLWIFYDDAGNMIGQINGFALVDGQINTTALSGTLVAVSNYVMPDFTANSPQQVVFNAPFAELQPYWEAAKDCAELITSMNLPYYWSEQNSNSVYSTVGECMVTTAPNVGAFYTPTPGLGNILLSSTQILEIQGLNGITSGGPGRTRPPEEIDYPQFVHEPGAQATLVGISDYTV